MCKRKDGDFPWLSEFLCEYVDGTMDPAARAMFEECLPGNPELEAYVDRLKFTRTILCDYGCHVQAPCNLTAKLHLKIAQESVRATPPSLVGRSGRAAIRLHSATVLMATLAVMAFGVLSAQALFPTEVSAAAPALPDPVASSVSGPALFAPLAALTSARPDSVHRFDEVLRIHAEP